MKNQPSSDLIVIDQVTTDAGIEAEYRYIDEVFGVNGKDWIFISQKLKPVQEGDFSPITYVDIIKIELQSGEFKELAFDITSFYGKW